ncbi:MAG: hypothetical protein WBC02_02450, partial [Candidatus Aminicenantaceae bacterium]
LRKQESRRIKKIFYNRLDPCFRRNDERIGKTFHQLNGRRAKNVNSARKTLTTFVESKVCI